MKVQSPSPHTLLINYLIGFCKKGESWIHPLGDLGYQIKLLEQTFSLRQSLNSEEVKPDVIAVSNSLKNALVFDCKGGNNVDLSQVKRYELLEMKDLSRYLDFFDEDSFNFDVCFFCHEENYQRISSHVSGFPMLVLGSARLGKHGNFTKQAVNAKFVSGIIIDETNTLPPTFFYPFSVDDDQGLIIWNILQAIVSILLDKKTRGTRIFDENSYQDTYLMTKIHTLWGSIGQANQRLLFQKVHDSLDILRTRYPDFHEQVLEIQQSEGDKSKSIGNLIKMCEEIAAKERPIERLTDYPSYPRPSVNPGN